MATYKTETNDNRTTVGNGSALSNVLDHLLAYEKTMTSAMYVDGRYIISVTPDLTEEEIEHLHLEVV